MVSDNQIIPIIVKLSGSSHSTTPFIGELLKEARVLVVRRLQCSEALLYVSVDIFIIMYSN